MSAYSSLTQTIASLAVLAALAGTPAAQAQSGPSLAGCPMFPADNIWNTPVDTLPVDANSTAYINTIGGTRTLHPDFGSGLWNGGPIGIPYVVVPGTQPKVPVSFDYDDESDPGPYPIPPNPPIEGGPNSSGDRHILVVDRDNCLLYETWSTYPAQGGGWHAGSGAKFDLRSHALRPDGWTSSDAAGLPVLHGLVRYDEVAAGEIKHALRFTVPQTRRAYVWPARHYASSLTGMQYPPMGQRFRLKAGYDISGFAETVQVILRALKKYGMMLADNGSAWYISGVPDERWNNDLLRQLQSVPGNAFEAVDVSSLMINANSGQAAGQASAPMAVEFYNAQLRHYFLTASADEATGVDQGAAGPGWARTGHTFRTGGSAPVCRFYGNQMNGESPQGPGPNSHFYTSHAGECDWVKLDPGWIYEGIAFQIDNPVSGQCATGRIPVYRAYNMRWAMNDSNHRITADYTAYQATVASGWAPEGVVMCAAP